MILADNQLMKIDFGKKIAFVAVLLLFSFTILYADTSYKVEKGDTLYSISRKYQITVAELRAANNLTENDVLKAGQKLKIPTADISAAAALATDNKVTTSTTTVNTNTTTTKEYTVVKGDTLYSIAKKNGLTVAELMALNGLDSSTVIKIGQKLKITTAASSTTKPAVTTTPTPTKTETVISQAPATNPPDTRTYGATVDADSKTVWPVKNPKVTQVKGKVGGVQLSAEKDEAVNCIREGTVMYVGIYRGFGQVLFVQSKTGVIYTYTGLGSVNVKKGDYVTFGTKLGTAGIDPISNKSGITFMVFQNGQPIDPATAPRS